MGVLLKFMLHLVATILWKKVGGSGAIPPVPLPRGKRPLDIPVVSPWQTFAVMWAARKIWASYGGNVKGKMASSPNGTVQQVGSWLPNAPDKKAAKTAAPSVPAPARKPSLWTGSAQPAAPASPQPPAAPAAPSAPRPAPHYATRRFDTQDTAPSADAAPPAAPTPPVPPAPAPVAAPAPSARPGSLLSSLRKRS